MTDCYVGQITVFAFPFTPYSWAACNGGNAPINQYGALYALIGNRFGGDGVTQFGLPNLANASPCGTGAGPGLTPRSLGQAFGSATVTLDQTTMPAHNHAANAAPSVRGTTPISLPTALSALTSSTGVDIYSDGAPNAVMSPASITPAGSGGAHNNMQPYIAMNYCIALMGIYPDFG